MHILIHEHLKVCGQSQSCQSCHELLSECVYRSTNPLTGASGPQFYPPTRDAFETLVSGAASYASEFAQTSLDSRFVLVEQLRGVLVDRQVDIRERIHTTIGKPLADSEVEVLDIVAGIDVYLTRKNELRRLVNGIAERGVVPDTELTFTYKPVGTVGLIMPWNFPFWMPMGFIVPALLAGNPVMLKPSPYASAVGALIVDLVRASGFDKRAIQVVHGDAVVGNMMVNHPQVKKLAFVGSTLIGLNIAQQRVSQSANNFTLEMGGNSAAIVCSDADVDNAVASIFWNSTYYAGQVCTGVKRVLIHESLFAQLRERLVALAKKYNDPKLLIEHIGAIISDEMLNIVEYRVERAVAAGNELLTGGKRLDKMRLPKANKNGHFFPVTVMEMSDHRTDLVMKETFAPVLPLIPFRTLDEAATIAGETDYELSANVFTQNDATVDYLLGRLNAGMIFLNDSEVSYPGGNFWKGHAQSYLSTSDDDRLLGMYEKRLVWRKDASVRRDYWFE